MSLDTIGKRLTYARDKKGMKQNYAAKKIGVSAPTLANYESDHRKPDPETTKKLAELYDVNPAWILGFTENHTPEKKNSSHTVHDEESEILSVEEYIEMARSGVSVKKGKRPLSGKQLSKLIQMMSTVTEVFDDEEEDEQK